MSQASSNGLKGSMWASSSTRPYTYYRPDPRPRSVPLSPSPHDAHRKSSNNSPAPNGSTTFLTPAPAPTIATAPTRSSAVLPPSLALHRLEQTCLRLRWKSIDLDNAWRRAQSPGEGGWTPEHAEGNFKVDFYEFYAWIEQALVLLQRIFGVEISSGRGGRSWSSGGTADHSFHHNVLAALEEEGNPLRGVLGSGEVRHALWKAKELRNRWKDAAAGEKETPPLRMYDLSWIVGNILAGLEAAYGVAAGKVRELEEAEKGGSAEATVEDQGWDWMVEDSMDWEA
ncbi:unnamed protein product [Clonostachys rhizophaga]|uniref:Uncharacterized protein n=1 Tax=Clonostachys rhizophaga TaxID=160324 RepID=A0A9N9W1P1_9HYPO|nr:unnamed protein product [Clonostachys rhizophaga]